MELRLEREPPGSDDPPDPNRPVNRRSVLGRMHQYKQEGWKKHLEDCEREVYMCTYVNKNTGTQMRLVDTETSGELVTYILEDEAGKKHRWSEMHFKRCWQPLSETEGGE